MKSRRKAELEPPPADALAADAGPLLVREPPRASEARLIALLPTVPKKTNVTRLLCQSAGRAQLAEAAARGDPARRVACNFLDLHLAQRAREAVGPGLENLAIGCAADLPSGPFDAALLPLRAGADSELAWETMQDAFLRLETGGQLFTCVDEPRDRWVAGRMDALFDGRVARHGDRETVAYVGVKRQPLAKVKSFECEFAFRDRGQLVKVVSRPGVFSHRRLDLGARALIESLVETEENGLEREHVAAGARVLDLGCGAGAVGFAAALRAPDVAVHAVDSMPRAIECARRGAELNGLARFTTQAVSDGAIDGAGTFDLVLGNPPYYSQNVIAEVFVRASLLALKQGGRAQFVTRQPDWFVERMPRDFNHVVVRALRTYSVVSGVRKPRGSKGA